MHARLFTAAMVYAAAAAATAQTLQWTKIVDEGSRKQRNEVALAVNRQGRDVLVAWQHFDIPNSRGICYYNYSADGENFLQAAPVPLPNPLPHGYWGESGDPTVVFSQEADIANVKGWVSSIGVNNIVGNFFWLAQKPIGIAPLATATEITLDAADSPDKGFLVTGPLVGGGPDILGMVNSRLVYSPNPAVYRLKGNVSTDQGTTWNQPPFQQFPVGADLTPPPPPQFHHGNPGGNNGSVILRTGANAGRWVVAHRPNANPTDPVDLLPRATFGDASGTLWANSVSPTRARIPGSALTEQISGIHRNFLGQGPYVPGTPTGAGTWPTGAKTTNFPSLASNPNNGLMPNNGDTLYMVFSGTAESSGGPNNADLFIAFSIDGGANFSGNVVLNQEGFQVLHLTDADLGDTPGTQQFMPAITVDATGGINIFYYTAELPIDPPPPLPLYWRYRAKYARLAGFTTTTGPHPVFNLALGSYFTLEDVAPGLPPPDEDTYHMGDYNMADSRGCEVYGGYVSRPLVNGVLGPLSVHVSKINVCDATDDDADIDQNRVVDASDASLFRQLYVSRDPRADVNHDASIDAADLYHFNQVYGCRCMPHAPR